MCLLSFVTAVPAKAGTHPVDGAAVWLSSQRHLGVAIDPPRVIVFDKLDFPKALPPFNPLFANHRCFQCVVTFEPDEPIDAVLCGKSWNSLCLVLPDPPNEI